MKMRTIVNLAAALTAMTLSAPLVAQAASDWVRMSEDDEAEYFYDRAGMRRDGDRVAATLRMVTRGEERRTLMMDLEGDCAAQTTAFLAGRELGADGAVLRAATVPADRVRPEPIFAGSEWATVYSNLCPAGADLPAPPPMPMIVATPPGSRSGNCPDAGSGSCGD